MKRKLLVRRRAELEVNKAVIWLEEQRPGLGREFLSEVRATLREMEDRPLSFPLDYKKARRALTDFFIVEDKWISIVAVLHTSQDKRRHLRGRL